MSPRFRSLAIYVAKNITGVVLSYLVSYFVHWIDFAWCLISVVLVLSPEGTDAIPLAFTRIKANLVGASIGALILWIEMPRPYNMGTGVVFALLVTDLFKLNAGAKSALAAMIIILMHPEGQHPWDTALGRMSAVVIGCLLGLGITFLFHKLFKIKTPVWAEQEKKEQES